MHLTVFRAVLSTKRCHHHNHHNHRRHQRRRHHPPILPSIYPFKFARSLSLILDIFVFVSFSLSALSTQ